MPPDVEVKFFTQLPKLSFIPYFEYKFFIFLLLLRRRQDCLNNNDPTCMIEVIVLNNQRWPIGVLSISYQNSEITCYKNYMFRQEL